MSSHQDLAWMHDTSLRVKPPLPYSVRRRRFWRVFWIAAGLITITCALIGANYFH